MNLRNDFVFMPSYTSTQIRGKVMVGKSRKAKTKQDKYSFDIQCLESFGSSLWVVTLVTFNKLFA
uniref:Uncharacterized protein n=1 Tax=Anguilla anguilla TaxID=7936 RepID=A0A0E9X802_ANGAN